MYLLWNEDPEDKRGIVTILGNVFTLAVLYPELSFE